MMTVIAQPMLVDVTPSNVLPGVGLQMMQSVLDLKFHQKETVVM